jgi:hypothetical protein
MPVKGVHDGLHPFPCHGVGLGVQTDIFGVRDLFYANNNVHGVLLINLTLLVNCGYFLAVRFF